MKKVINYFDRTELISSAKEGIDFINSLQYRGNGHNLFCNSHTEKLLIDVFNGTHPYPCCELATTGCSMTRINLYNALADTLEEHNTILAQIRAEKVEESKRQREEWHNYIKEENRGWYIVTVTGVAFKNKGNDGEVTTSFKVMANSKMEAYDMVCEKLRVNPPKNVCGWYYFESPLSALIEYVGVWTDELELEYS